MRDDGWQRHGRAVRTSRGRRVPGGAGPALYGAAVDVGTSKIIVYLFDLDRGTLVDQEAVENPQMRYGEDVISRIAQAVRPERAAAAGRAPSPRASTPTWRALCERQGIEARQIST